MLPGGVGVDKNKRKKYQNETKNFFSNKNRFFDDVKLSFF